MDDSQNRCKGELQPGDRKGGEESVGGREDGREGQTGRAAGIGPSELGKRGYDQSTRRHDREKKGIWQRRLETEGSKQAKQKPSAGGGG